MSAASAKASARELAHAFKDHPVDAVLEVKGALYRKTLNGFEKLR